MTKEDTKTHRSILEIRRAELENGSRSREMLGTEATPDELDRIQQSTEREYAMGSLERNLKRLREVCAALRRMDDGTFGVCGNCEEEIAPKRLAAVPWATLCIVCQEAADIEERTAASRQMDESLVAA